jgi:hypothetical protein
LDELTLTGVSSRPGVGCLTVEKRAKTTSEILAVSNASCWLSAFDRPISVRVRPFFDNVTARAGGEDFMDQFLVFIAR